MSEFIDPNTDYNSTEYDFGFTAVDADELNITSTSTTQSSEEIASQVSSSVQSTIKSLEQKIADLSSKVATPAAPTDLSSLTKRLEEKMDKMLSMQLQELTSALTASDKNVRAVIDEVEERKEELNVEYTEKMKELEKLILPLLYNLMKNPDKEYIKWPNRTEMLNKHISKILEITKSPLVL